MMTGKFRMTREDDQIPSSDGISSTYYKDV